MNAELSAEHAAALVLHDITTRLEVECAQEQHSARLASHERQAAARVAELAEAVVATLMVETMEKARHSSQEETVVTQDRQDLQEQAVVQEKMLAEMKSTLLDSMRAGTFETSRGEGNAAVRAVYVQEGAIQIETSGARRGAWQGAVECVRRGQRARNGRGPAAAVRRSSSRRLPPSSRWPDRTRRQW